MTSEKIPAIVIVFHPGTHAGVQVLSEFFNGVRALAVRRNIRCVAA